MHRLRRQCRQVARSSSVPRLKPNIPPQSVDPKVKSAAQTSFASAQVDRSSHSSATDLSDKAIVERSIAVAKELAATPLVPSNNLAPPFPIQQPGMPTFKLPSPVKRSASADSISRFSAIESSSKEALAKVTSTAPLTHKIIAPFNREKVEAFRKDNMLQGSFQPVLSVISSPGNNGGPEIDALTSSSDMSSMQDSQDRIQTPKARKILEIVLLVIGIAALIVGIGAAIAAAFLLSGGTLPAAFAFIGIKSALGVGITGTVVGLTSTIACVVLLHRANAQSEAI